MADESPDRVTSFIAYSELKLLFPNRKWNLLLCDITNDIMKKMENSVTKLCYPQNTLMDLSISTSLYAGSKSQGRICSIISPLDILQIAMDFQGKCNDALNTTKLLSSFKHTLGDMVTAKSKVLLSGLGADEIFGGYSRHLILYIQNNPWMKIEQEMSLGINITET